MITLKPERIDELSENRKKALLKRSMEDISSIAQEVKAIISEVKSQGDEASLRHYSKYKSDISPEDLEVTVAEIEEAYRRVDQEVLDALKKAAEHIEKFHRTQLEREITCMEIAEGILAGRMIRPLQRVGAYIPGGRAAYPSSVLMNILPAKVAGVEEIVVCTPPGPEMKVADVILVAAQIAGASRSFKVGGPWAIASLAYGTDKIPKVDKIVGPGNKYVTAAKMMVYGVVDIDSPAGPSETLILADGTADPGFITADMFSQLEHDQDAAAVLVSTSEEVAEEVCRLITERLDSADKKEVISAALQKHSALMIAQSMEEALRFTNQYAPEHLQIMTRDPWNILPRIHHAGSIFLGPYAPVAAGDYASGTNHVLPTGQGARMFSGLSVDDFIKKPTFQYLSKEGLKGLEETIVTLAEAEGLPMHARSVKERFMR